MIVPVLFLKLFQTLSLLVFKVYCNLHTRGERERVQRVRAIASKRAGREYRAGIIPDSATGKLFMKVFLLNALEV